MLGDDFADEVWCSRVFIVETSEEASDDLKHGSAKAYFVAYFAAEYTKALHLRGHCLVVSTLLLRRFLLTDTMLPLV